MLAKLFNHEPEQNSDHALIRVSRIAMATRFEIALPMGTPYLLEAAEAALDLIDELEDQLTIYREHSEISRLNSRAFQEAVGVEAGLFELLEQCSRLHLETSGAFDAASGALSDAWGFTRREGRVPTTQELRNAMRVSGMRHVILDGSNRTVRYRREGLKINLGSIGKGYALDRAAELLRSRFGTQRAMLQAGGSSMLAIGEGWKVAISHPHDPRRSLGTVTLNNQGFATTAATYQQFDYNGKNYGHVIDPRTGRPAEHLDSASAIAVNAAEADAMSTAIFVMGNRAAEAWLATRDDAAAVLLQGDRPIVLNQPRYTPPSLGEMIRVSLSIPEW